MPAFAVRPLYYHRPHTPSNGRASGGQCSELVRWRNQTGIHGGLDSRFRGNDGSQAGRAPQLERYRFRRIEKGYCAVNPPSTAIASPVTSDAASEHSQATDSAISSGVPSLPMGCREGMAAS